jgi:hypothetical protein
LKKHITNNIKINKLLLLDQKWNNLSQCLISEELFNSWCCEKKILSTKMVIKCQKLLNNYYYNPFISSLWWSTNSLS